MRLIVQTVEALDGLLVPAVSALMTQPALERVGKRADALAVRALGRPPVCPLELRCVSVARVSPSLGRRRGR